ncbi:MAG: hypothetical protein ACFCU3_06120 [Verrucomicrobiales bacterium]
MEKTPLPDDIFDIVGPFEVTTTTGPWLWILLGCVALLLGFLVLWLKSRGPDTLAQARAGEQAFAILNELRNNTSLGLREVAQQASNVLRDYFMVAFALRSPYQTSQEFLRDLSERPRLRERVREKVADFLELVDPLKYAPDLPMETDQARLIDQACSVLESAEDVVLQEIRVAGNYGGGS